ncbi:MAG: hypothetical protein PHP02_06780 [Eubacteriales bacterium]|nr:hypothetical protein [Eubacteriales bacterium]
MKENPKDALLRVDMEAGRLIKDGFLGEDRRPVSDIISQDLDTLAGLQVSHVELGRAMRRLTRGGMDAIGEEADVGDYLVKMEEYMGWLGCPFKDGRRAAKRNTWVKDKASGKEMRWTDLTIHLIEAHAFFQGRGSAFRLEPEALAAFLKLPGAETTDFE